MFYRGKTVKDSKRVGNATISLHDCGNGALNEVYLIAVCSRQKRDFFKGGKQTKVAPPKLKIKKALVRLLK